MGISIKGLDRATVLAALVNAAKPVGLGRTHLLASGRMTAEEARQYINERAEERTRCTEHEDCRRLPARARLCANRVGGACGHADCMESPELRLECWSLARGEPVRLDFDYLNGRPIKVDLGPTDLDTRLYNRDQGAGAAERVVEALRGGQ